MARETIGTKDGQTYFVGQGGVDARGSTSSPPPAPTPAPVSNPTPTLAPPVTASAISSPTTSNLPKPAVATDEYSEIYRRSQNALLTEPAPAKTKDQIYQDRLKQSQGLIDSINQNFYSQEQSASKQAAKLDKQTRQAMISQGLAGSSAAVPAIKQTTDANNAVMASLQAQKANQIQGILTGIQSYADEEFTREQERFKAEAEGNIEMVDKIRQDKLNSMNKAVTDFTKFAGLTASSPLTWKELNELDPETTQAWKNATGKDDLELSMIMNSAKAGIDKVVWNDKMSHYDEKRGVMVMVGTKGDGSTVVQEQATKTQVPAGFKPQMLGDQMFLVDENGIQIGEDGSITGLMPYGSTGQFKVDGTNTPGDTTYEEGADPVVDSWANRIMSGQAKLSDLTGAKNTGLKNQVVVALDAMSGNKLGPVQQNIVEAKKLVDELINHPGRKAVTGMPNLFTNPFGMSLPSSNARDFKAKVERLNALLFLNAVPQMKGMGQLTEREGAKLEASSSITREFGVDENTYLEELNRLKGNLDSAYINLGGDDTANLGKNSGGGGGNIIEYNGKQYETDADGNFDPNSPLTKAGSGANNAQAMRTDRHNNPTAFTTDIAKMAGLREGVDYAVGDPFSNGQFKTAKLLRDPIATTIKVIDKIGFNTSSGKPRWTYTNSIPETKNWNRLSYEQKKGVIAKMYKHEGGSQLSQYFA